MRKDWRNTMTNKNYIAGRRFEYKVKKYYENKGYTVLRTSGSHGFADLVAVKNSFLSWRQNKTKTIIFIQCKNQKPTKQEIKKFEEFDWLSSVDMSTIVYIDLIYPEKLKSWEQARSKSEEGGNL